MKQMRKNDRRKTIRGLGQREESAMRAAMLQRCCSAAWVDAQFATIYDAGPDGESIATRVHNRRVYPPQADTSPMVECRACGVPMPYNVVGSSGICLDCCIADNADSQHVWGESPFHRAMEVLRVTKTRLREMKLE